MFIVIILKDPEKYEEKIEITNNSTKYNDC